jgi:hypothetical protein
MLTAKAASRPLELDSKKITKYRDNTNNNTITYDYVFYNFPDEQF